ncbi:hypothetical protein F0310_04295 (plasmid) [Borrelia sp. A-FGy1]|uniref:hypothetical protein n=1 Tax=Borrelia sp. A-FGy1 TaxID=2608247 RepID=UPI0015F3DBBD|nr:hypothetical protein [Borrelia sp. A-FGy1]QMU99638.1 hypothetical protein F0310_04295 [Borrelia sp. A-FGy1]
MVIDEFIMLMKEEPERVIDQVKAVIITQKNSKQKMLFELSKMNKNNKSFIIKHMF